MMGSLRIWGRLLLVFVWTLIAMPVQALLLVVPGWAKQYFARFYWRGVRRILGVRLTILGQISPRRPTIFIANHCSWLDIITLGSVLPGCFVAKGEIAGWPLISTVARLGRTIFVSRAKAGIERERNVLLERLAAGDNIILFPEGTTSDGTRILPFQTSFLVVAAAPSKPDIQLVTLVYDRINGLPMHRRDRPIISWYGDMTMAAHYPGVGRLGSLHATLILDAVIPAGAYAGRKQLAAALEARLAANAAALRQGRQVFPI